MEDEIIIIDDLEDEEKLYTIYGLVDPISNEIRYVGATSQQLVDRMYCHTSIYKALEWKNSIKSQWLLPLLEQGLKPTIETLDIVAKKEWEFWEQYWISQLKTWGFNLTNTTKGGLGCFGGKGCSGYSHTEEAKKAISEKNSKILKTKEWIDKIAKSNSIAIIQCDLAGNKIKEWISSSEAARVLFNDEEKKKNITSVCKGKRNYAYGYVWKYKNTEL